MDVLLTWKNTGKAHTNAPDFKVTPTHFLASIFFLSNPTNPHTDCKECLQLSATTHNDKPRVSIESSRYLWFADLGHHADGVFWGHVYVSNVRPVRVAYNRPYKSETRASRLHFLLPPFSATKRKGKRSPQCRLNYKRQGPTNTTGPATAQQQQDKTALEIAAGDALFGQTGADEPWASPWGDSWHPVPNLGGSNTSSNHNPRQTGGNRKTGKGSAEAPMMMGPYDRGGVHHRGPQVAGTSHQLPLRKAPPSTSSANPTPYFHHLLDRSSSASSSTNSLLFTPTSSFVDAPVPMNSAGKRPRPSSTNNSFLTPSFGFPSPPPFETEHPLPDFNNWGFAGKNVTRSSSASTNTLTATSHGNSASNATTTSSLSAIGSGLSSPNGASMFAGVDSFLPDYDSTLYSLWNAPGGAGVMDYDTENDAAQDPHQQVQPPLYITSDDELKMDYPQLTEFNQDLDSYLNDTMESGGPSPTTPLGTSTAHSMMKMDHLVATDRRTGAAGLGSLTGVREPQLLAPAAATGTAEYLKRDREVTGSETTSEHSVKRSRGDFNDAYGIAPITSGNVIGSIPCSSTTTVRNLPKSTVIEPKRAMPSLGSFHSGPSPLMLTSAAGQASSRTSTTATVVTSTTTSDTAAIKAGKRPRSRQCEFPGCQNRARSHQKCKKHGGAHQCVFEGCTKNSQSRGLCIAHGGGSRCKREGCVRAAQSKGLCKSHGGGEFCAVEGCNKKAHLKHLCRTHGGGVRCKVDKCLKWAQRKGWCMAHAKEFSAQ